MKKIAATVLTVVMSTGLLSTSAMADADKGQKFYTKKLKDVCGFSGAKMAGMHTQDEWQDIFDDGKLGDEIKKQCPNVKDGMLIEKYMPHLYDFLHKYGSDSGNVPAC